MMRRGSKHWNKYSVLFCLCLCLKVGIWIDFGFVRFGFFMSKTQILTPMLIYFRPLSFFTPRGALMGPRGGESAGSPPGLLNIPTNCILTKDGTFCRMRSLPHIFVAMALHYMVNASFEAFIKYNLPLRSDVMI